MNPPDTPDRENPYASPQTVATGGDVREGRFYWSVRQLPEMQGLTWYERQRVLISCHWKLFKSAHCLLAFAAMIVVCSPKVDPDVMRV